MSPGTILIVEPQAAQRQTLVDALQHRGHVVFCADGADDALWLLSTRPVEVVLSGLDLSARAGRELVAACRSRWPELPIVAMAAGIVVDDTVAIASGHLDAEQLSRVIGRALMARRLADGRPGADVAPPVVLQLRGSSAAMAEVMACAARAADTDATVLIAGESGTGKELLARAIHELSPRGSGPFVAVNGAALASGLFESELFGHVKGAFTGAAADRPGRVEQARGGTFFLDEVGDLPPPEQVKLLRFLQEREITPVGGDRAVAVDVRVVAATGCDLRARIAAGRFREDLFFRLNVIELALPPLRDRRQDIPELADLFQARYARRHGRPARSFSAEAMAALMAHPYAGNVRELENLVERAVVMARGDVIGRDDLPLSRSASAPGGRGGDGSLAAAVEAFERRIVSDTLAACSGNQTAAARRLGMTESGLRYKLGRWRRD